MTSNISKNNRRSANLLPTYFQTPKNSKFLSSTIDQLYKVPVLERINGFVGSKLTPTYNSQTDIYLSDKNDTENTLREKYQFDPALTVRTEEGKVKKVYGFDDLVNQLKVYGADVSNLSKLFSPEVNPYNPRIDWDKFVNFREYYWLINGPSTVTITGLQKETASTYTVGQSENGAYFIFTPDGITDNPVLTLYKGITYAFNVDTTAPLYFKFTNQAGVDDALTEESGVLNNGENNGQIIFSVSETLPPVLYYSSENDEVVLGTILIKEIEENSSLDVEAEIIGKQTYKSYPTAYVPEGIEFINGLKIRFAGNITPAFYQNKEFIVEGVGTAIKLIDFSSLQTPDDIASLYDDDFDIEPFDDFPFDGFENLPLVPEYVTINRASKDLNPWSRYNRWFHTDVLNISAIANGIIPVLPLQGKARRPIIEFEADLQLYNFGTVSIPAVDLIDTEIVDAFSTVESSTSFTIDGVPLSPGMRVIFNADLDPLKRGKVFEVGLSLVEGIYRINLAEIISPIFGTAVTITSGDEYQGTEWWFNGSYWVTSQQRTRLNQAPLFDLFDESGQSYSNKNYYDSIFSGNKIFGYGIGTGRSDSVLGFPLKYKSVGIEGSYLFENYFNNVTVSVLGENTVTEIPTSRTYIRKNADTGYKFLNVWDEGVPYQLAVQQFQVVTTATSIPITVFDNPSLITDLSLTVFANGEKLLPGTDYYTTSTQGTSLTIELATSFNETTNLLINCYTKTAPNETGVYETPINLTNNPLNDYISQFTLSEIQDHVQTMTERSPDFRGTFPGASNLKSLPNISKYGTRLIVSHNPVSFSQLYLTEIQNSLISAIRSVSVDYYQFKLNLIKFISDSDGSLSPREILDQALNEIIKNKNYTFPYAESDMMAYGNNNSQRTYTVTDSRNTAYPILSDFSISTLSSRSVLVYLNNEILIYDRDYVFDSTDPNVRILVPLSRGDVIVIRDYPSTIGSFIPPTPTKLGLYPKYEPAIYLDKSYAFKSSIVIQGHDGSLTVAYTTVEDALEGNYDYRDLALLEFESRIFNNIKVTYNTDLLNIDDILPGAFRDNDFTYRQYFNFIQKDFITWASTYGIDYTTNNTYDVDNHKTYNYRSAQDTTFNTVLPGNWRGIYKWFFDTDRPNTHPWEMLGFTVKPSWWESYYGPAPYTSGNLNLWEDLEAGLIRQGPRAGVDLTYVRPGLSQIIPVDENGNIIDVRFWGILGDNEYVDNSDQDWIFSDHGPVETAWRRSSLWPFAVQIMLALSKPANYAAKMFDPARLSKDATEQYKYGPDDIFLDPATMFLNGDTDASGNIIISSGYSVYVLENGKKRTIDYLSNLKQDLENIDFNLFYKVGGFLSKDKLDIIIDSVSPNTINPGVLLPDEDYELHFNVSNPIDSVSISGIIIEKKQGLFLIKGYDRQNPYFVINRPIHRANDILITVGGKSVPVLTWKENTFYQAGQYVKFESSFYTVARSVNSGDSFDPLFYNKLPSLPIIGGASAYSTLEFEKEETVIPYGTRYSTLQEVYDLVVGYGVYLTNKGFVFNDYSSDLEQIVDWKFSAKEFLFWTTQNWASGSVITLSPFANKLEYKFNDAVVDNVLNSFYDYSLLNANGQPFPPKNFSLSREEGVCTIITANTAEGFYFVKLNLIQKEHAIVMNNTTMFGDIVYDLETGYRQRRMKLSGFITGEWNGDFLSPGFIYDEAIISNWQSFKDYRVADVVKYSGKYYSANENIPGAAIFDFNKWSYIGTAPVAELLPNFDYKINQFEDFYSLDIDNFDAGQQKMAQHLIGYTPRIYLTNIIIDPIAQYKFYQGFIKEKGTANSISKLSKASIHNLNGEIAFNEEWAFRIGSYGNFTSYNEIEFPLREADFKENTQILKFVDIDPNLPNDFISYIVPTDLTIKNSDYSSNSVFATITSCTYSNTNILLPVAGYIKIDDITATAYNKTSLLDISNPGAIKEGNTIWLGFKENGDWDVYRYTKQPVVVVDTDVIEPQVTLKFTTDKFHNLVIGDIVSVYGLDNGADGIYEVLDIPSLTSFVVSTTLGSVPDSQTDALLFKFISVRVSEFDDILNLSEEIDFVLGDKVWADRGDGTADWSKWAVYQKIYNYTTSSEILSSSTTPEQRYGWQISTYDNTDRLVVSAPGYASPTGKGRIYVFELIPDEAPLNVVSFTLNASLPSSTDTEFGYDFAWDDEYDTVVGGAPAVDRVQISKIVRQTGQELTLNILTASTGSRYGSSIFLAKERFSTSTGKALLIAAPNNVTSTGSVYAYNLIVETVSSATTSTLTLINEISMPSTTLDYKIAGNIDGTRIAISEPEASTGTGKVSVYFYDSTGTTYNLYQTISAPSECQVGDNFGIAIEMSDDGEYLFASSLRVTDTIYSPGRVYVYQWNTSTYDLVQTLKNPLKNIELNFGNNIKINSSNDNLIVSAEGTQNSELEFNDDTLFDGGATVFFDFVVNSGDVFIFEKIKNKFIYSCELFDKNVLNVLGEELDYSGTGYGKSIAINNNYIFVGAPFTASLVDDNIGAVYEFDKLNADQGCWSLLRQEDDLVDITKSRRSITIDTVEDVVVDYLDIIDPIKGKIAGLADQEIRYKTAFDPAVYSVGNQGVVVDNKTSWADEHLGELWWDLSTVKYIWYEQGDVEYRKNSWGKLFPGATIDIYEWIKSEYLPSQWSTLADTTDGLIQGISGQPKYPDNSVVSVTQYYNPSTGAATNVYYYWVKNTVILPNVSNRKVPANIVSSLIFDPAAFGQKFISILSKNAISVSNLKNTLRANDIYLNMSKDDLDSKINRHTEWVLLGENNETNMPTPMLEKKLIDSLVGKDSLGNLVPDPTLSDRLKYGIEIRPRQGMFVNRTSALRNVIEFVNGVLKEYRFTDLVNFRYLNSKREIPDIYSREYDQIVDNYEDLADITVSVLNRAVISAEINTNTGVISTINVINSGTGYVPLLPVQLNITGDAITWAGPLVTVVNDTVGAEIDLQINELGNVISTATTIVNAGRGYTVPPELSVRPYTVIVRTDSNSNNRWAKYELQSGKWVKVFTQDYDTTQYWNYVNWTSDDYDPLKPLVATVDETYQLAALELADGEYVKVKNQGNGRYIILQKVLSNGNFDDEYNLVLSENGTFEFTSNLWDLSNSRFNFDAYFTYDQTLYDQTPEQELINILKAIKEDIFVGSFKIYWNKFFFASVKYAMTEQKFLDWAFKTSFINARNLAGELDQRPVFKFQNSLYYEDYIKEVKPYHTKIRNYQVNYTLVDPSRTYTTDFDLPPYFNRETDEFTTLSLGDPLLNEYPWKGWADNYTYSIGSIEVASGGSGYTLVPTVQIITAPGDTGSGATAEALISLGRVTAIVVTNPGSGYVKTPRVVITGGGTTSIANARAYPIMTNGKVRTNLVEMKFDRVSPYREITTSSFVDVFVGDGEQIRFPLTWAAENKKADIDISVNGLRVLATDYNIITYRNSDIGYNKVFSDVVLETAPSDGSILRIEYKKNINLYYAVDRIFDYYRPTVGMPGVDLPQLMKGIEYPGALIQGLPFDYTTNWDIKPFGQSLFGDDSDGIVNTTSTVAAFASTGTTTLVVSSIDGVVIGSRATTVVLSTTTSNENKFASGVATVIAVDTATSAVTFNTGTVDAIYSGTVLIQFWDFNMVPGVLDTILEGGDLGYLTATGEEPEDVIVDGETFISPNISHAPEEMLKGEMHESFGLNVYTREASGSPIVTQSYSYIDQVNTVTTLSLMMLPPNTSSVSVIFNNNLLNHDIDFTIDFINETITINTQTTTGLLGITVVGVGGDALWSYDSVTVSNTSTAGVRVGAYANSNGIYATLNGLPISSTQYTIISGKLVVENLNSGPNILQAWVFGGGNMPYSSVNEEVIDTIETVNTYQLQALAGRSWAPDSTSIVTLNERVLVPPDSTYYSVAAGQTDFLVDPYDARLPGAFDINSIDVFVNGIRMRRLVDYVLDQTINTVVFKPNFLQTGDVLAITNHSFSDYYFDEDNSLIILRFNPSFNKLKVITFTNGDSSLIRTEAFNARSSRRYPISRKLLNHRYLWVSIEGKSLVNGLDYYLDNDQQTIVLRDTWPYIPGQVVSIMSMTDITANRALGYRVFTDMLNRTQYKRLSRDYSTRLSAPLYTTSTEIMVENALALPAPNPALKIPGVVLIGGERIEYMAKGPDSLRNIKRATLGTGAKSVYSAGTRVFDQGINQNLPYAESLNVLTVTATNTTTYDISAIALTTSTAVDQLLVYYGGIPLKKAGYYKQDLAIEYDTMPYDIVGTTSTSTSLPSTTVLGRSYLVTSTNQVWTFADSKRQDAENGYIYRGLYYVEPEFTITDIVTSGTISTAKLNLNINSIITGTRITITQRLAQNNFYANTATSLLDDNGMIALILRDRPVDLLDKYYYGNP